MAVLGASGGVGQDPVQALLEAVVIQAAEQGRRGTVGIAALAAAQTRALQQVGGVHRVSPCTTFQQVLENGRHAGHRQLLVAVADGAVGGVGVTQRQHHDILFFVRGVDLAAVLANHLDVARRSADQHHALVGQGAPAKTRIEQADIGQCALEVIRRILGHLDTGRGLLVGRADIQRFVVHEPLEVMLLPQPIEKGLGTGGADTTVDHAVQRAHFQADAEFPGKVLQGRRHIGLLGVIGIRRVLPRRRNHRQGRGTGPHQQPR